MHLLCAEVLRFACGTEYSLRPDNVLYLMMISLERLTCDERS